LLFASDFCRSLYLLPYTLRHFVPGVSVPCSTVFGSCFVRAILSPPPSSSFPSFARADLRPAIGKTSPTLSWYCLYPCRTSGREIPPRVYLVLTPQFPKLHLLFMTWRTAPLSRHFATCLKFSFGLPFCGRGPHYRSREFCLSNSSQFNPIYQKSLTLPGVMFPLLARFRPMTTPLPNFSSGSCSIATRNAVSFNWNSFPVVFLFFL